jgi:homoserine trans-succinylase
VVGEAVVTVFEGADGESTIEMCWDVPHEFSYRACVGLLEMADKISGFYMGEEEPEGETGGGGTDGRRQAPAGTPLGEPRG